MIQYSWFVVHYTMLLPDNLLETAMTALLPDNLLETAMTALRVLIIFTINIHELMSDKQKRAPYIYTTSHAVSVKSLSVSTMWCVCW